MSIMGMFVASTLLKDVGVVDAHGSGYALQPSLTDAEAPFPVTDGISARRYDARQEALFFRDLASTAGNGAAP